MVQNERKGEVLNVCRTTTSAVDFRDTRESSIHEMLSNPPGRCPAQGLARLLSVVSSVADDVDESGFTFFDLLNGVFERAFQVVAVFG
jgi:hypothetical protein